MPRPHHKFLTTTDAFDLPAIMRAAWAKAFRKRARFPAALRAVWEEAKAEKGSLAWYAEADRVTAAMRAGIVPQPLSLIEAAESALLLAEHNDTDIGHQLVARARVRLDALQLAA